MTSIKQLKKRRQFMLKMISMGYPFDEYQPYLPDAWHSPKLACHYIVRDARIFIKRVWKKLFRLI